MLDRRNILKFLLAGAAGSLLTPLPWKLLDDSAVWTQNWPWIPEGLAGKVTFRRTASKLCPSAGGLRVQLVDGRPVRILPDPEHPLSLGGLSVLAVAEAQLLYSSARVRTPLRRGADGILRPVTATEAMRLFVSTLQKIQKQERADNVLCLCGDENGSMYEILSLLTHTLGSDAFYFMPSELQPHALAARAGGVDGLPCYRLEDSDLIVCLGADMLGTWGTVMRNNYVRAAARAPGAETASSRLVYCGPVRNATALAADAWLPLKPGTEGFLLLGLANMLLKDAAPPEIAAYTPDRVSAATGVNLAALRRLALDLSRARRPLILTGSYAGQGGAVALARLGFAANRLPAGEALTFMPGPEPVLAGALGFTNLARQDLYARAGASEEASPPELLITYDANPAFALPAEARVGLRLAEIPCKVAFSSFLDETALAADLVFPLPLGLERLDDIYTPFGSGRVLYNICPPVVKPVYGETAPPPAEILLQALAALGVEARGADGQKINSLEDLLRARTAQLGADFRSLMRGEPFTAVPRVLPSGESLTELARHLRRDESISLTAESASGQVGGIALAMLQHPAAGTAVSGIPPYAAASIDESELREKALRVCVNAATARRLGLKSGQQVRLSAKAGGAGAAGLRSLEARLAIFEGLMDNVIGLPLGYGHTGFDSFSQGRGVNALDLFSLAPEPESGASDGRNRSYYLVVHGLELKGA